VVRVLGWLGISILGGRETQWRVLGGLGNFGFGRKLHVHCRWVRVLGGGIPHI
jgi:hypothetical protein